MRQAALTRTIQSRGKERFLALRSRKAKTRPRINVTRDCRIRLWRLRRNPLVRRRSRFRPWVTVLPLRARVMTTPTVLRYRVLSTEYSESVKRLTVKADGSGEPSYYPSLVLSLCFFFTHSLWFCTSRRRRRTARESRPTIPVCPCARYSDPPCDRSR